MSGVRQQLTGAGHLPGRLELLPKSAVALIPLFFLNREDRFVWRSSKQQNGASLLTDKVWPQSLSVANEALSVGVGVRGPREALPRASGGAVRWFQRECRLQHS